ncbi:MAG: PAS domain S-box protein [Bacteroidales bacterium]|nr:PAS domain S-box protein [Bacteroidales bacterium]
MNLDLHSIHENFLDNFHISVAIAEISGKIVDINKAFCADTLFDRTEVINKNLIDFLSEDDRLVVKDWLNSVSNNESANFKNEVRYISKNSDRNWGVLTINKLNEPQSQLPYLSITISRLDDIYGLEQVLKENEQKFSHLFNKAPLLLALSTLEKGSYIDVNKEFVDKTGYEREELIGNKRENLNLTPVEYKNKLYEYLRDKGEIRGVEVPLIKKDGSLVHCLYSGNVIEIMGKKYLLSMAQDISQRKIAEKELAEARDFNDNLIGTANVIIIALDLDGNLVIFNKTAERITGYSKDELEGANWFDAIVPKEKFPEVWKGFKDLVTQGFPSEYVNPIITKAGEERIIRWSNNEMRKENNVIGTISFGVDITEQKKYELELKNAKDKAEKGDKLKTEFLNNMSHEIRTPLNGILGFANQLNDDDLTDDRRKLYVDIINNSSEQLLRIINDILEISQLETEQSEMFETEVCLNDLMLKLFSIFDVQAKENSIHLYLDKGLDNSKSTVYTDEPKLMRVLTHLLENAFKFTYSGNINFGYVLKGDTLQLFVKDTGIGIKQDSQLKIFKKFIQEDLRDIGEKKGLGLGLAIAKANTELLGGTIHLSSEVDKGSVFTINLPYKPVHEADLEQDSKGLDSELQTILIAEDEEINYLFLELVISSLIKNIKILHAKDGFEAVELFKRNKVDLIFMDIKMPRMDGYETAEHIFSMNRDTPIIALTAYSSDRGRVKALSAGFVDYLAKPVDHETLKACLLRNTKHVKSKVK